MKRKKAVHHRIEQRTADRKNARRRKRYAFRLKARATQLQSIKVVKEAAAQAKGD